MAKKESAPAEEPARVVFRLKLDHDDVYFGCEPIPKTEVAEGDAILDHAPDNPPGRYRWHQNKLEPLPESKQKAALGAPTLEQAFQDFLVNGAGGAKVKAWSKWFETTLDGRPQ